jgi:DNA-binding MarR family transcriptional regulator
MAAIDIPVKPSDTNAGKVAAAGKAAEISFGALEDDIGFLIRRAQVWIFNDFLKTLEPCAVKPAQYAVLTMVETNPGLSQMAVSKSLGIERAHLMHMLDALEGRGWLTRMRAGSDRRSHALHLTPEGKTFMRKVRKLVAVHEANVAAQLGGARHRQLLDALAVFR